MVGVIANQASNLLTICELAGSAKGAERRLKASFICTSDRFPLMEFIVAGYSTV